MAKKNQSSTLLNIITDEQAASLMECKRLEIPIRIKVEYE